LGISARAPAKLAFACAVCLTALSFAAPSGGSIAVPSVSAHHCPALGSGWRCWVATLPLDRSGHAHGRMHVAVALLHRPGPPRPTVLALAGGPGTPAIASARSFRARLAPLLATRDLLVVDDRGTGVSDPIACPDIDAAAVWSPEAVRGCAQALGPAAGHYGSDDVADDVEDVRRLLGLGPLVVYGVSYGSKTAVDYARRHPVGTRALVLDSPIVEDTDPFYRRSAVGAARVLANVCAEGHCPRGVDPVADLRSLVGRMHDGHLGSIDEAALLHLIVSGGPRLDALPPALHRAARGDTRALGALLPATVPDARAPSWLQQGGSNTVYLATSCDDGFFPWPHQASESHRVAAAERYVASLGDGAFAPFDHQVGMQYGEAGMCAAWPAAAERAAPAPPPDVPALLLVGGDDDLAPLEGAQEVAAQLPHAQLVTVAGAGHGVLRTAGPGADALRSFAAGLGQ